jgi:hypothetical protein
MSLKPFKFFSKDPINNYDGEYSLQAINLVQRYIDSRFTSGIRFNTTDAEFVMEEIRYSDGGISNAVVVVYLNNSPTRITYNISMGRNHPFITQHTVDYERPEPIHIGDLMGELINSIQVLNEQVRNDS